MKIGFICPNLPGHINPMTAVARHLQSLAQGVPQVAIPVTFDQPGVAARIAAKSTGVTVPFAKLTSDTLSMLLEEVMNNGVYRKNARNFQDIIRKTNGLSMAADIVERSFGVNKKPADRYAQPVKHELGTGT